MSKTTVSIKNKDVCTEIECSGIYGIMYQIKDGDAVDGQNALIGEITPKAAYKLGQVLADMVLDSDEMFNDEFVSLLFQLGFHGQMVKRGQE